MERDPAVMQPEENMPHSSQPQPAKKAAGGYDRILAVVAGILLVAIATWFAVFALRAGRSAAEVVNASADDLYAVQQEIVQVGVPGETEREVLFYVSEDALACALLSRGAGGYKLVTAAGHLPLTASGKQGIWMATSVPSDAKEFLVFGLLFDEELSSVEVDGVPAVVVDTGEYRCWYYLGAGNMSINSESVVYR